MPPKAKAKKGNAPKGHKLPDPLPLGEELQDMIKGRWRVGKPIGQGGFGLLYLASPSDEKGDPQYVVKVEPHSNGALFSELSFYQRVAKPDFINQWMSSKKMKSLGMPKYIASGKHDRGKEIYRFMIMERYDSDLQKKFEDCGKRFNHKTILTLAIQILDTLEYIHTKEYVHADIKASNLLLGYGKAKVNQAYLVDYGLAFRYSVEGKHKDYKEDPKRCHDGTIEFTSIDAHKGVCPSRRGDLEILGYCLLQWHCSRLPWEDKLTDANYVRDQKIKFMKNIPSLMKTCFGASKAPEEIQKYLEYVQKLKYDEKPDYAKCKKIFSDAFKKNGLKDDRKLDFTSKSINAPAKAVKGKRKSAANQSMHNISQTSFDFSSEEELSPSPAKRGRKQTGASRLKSPAGKTRTPASKNNTPARRMGSPERPLKGQGVKRILSPSSKKTGESPARSRVKNTAAKKTASPRAANVNHNNSTPRDTSVPKKPRRPKLSVGTQTSPGLKGLKRSREKRK